MCVGDNFGDCSAIDIACICADENLINSLSCCVLEECEADEVDGMFTFFCLLNRTILLTLTSVTIDFARTICEPQGVQVPEEAVCNASGGGGGGGGGDEEEATEDEDSEEDTDDDDAEATVVETETETEIATVTETEIIETQTDSAAAGNVAARGVGVGAAFAGLIALL